MKMLDKVLDVMPEGVRFKTGDLYRLIELKYNEPLNNSRKSNIRNSLLILIDLKILGYEGNRYLLLLRKKDLPEVKHYKKVVMPVAPIEKQALDWYPNANYGKILELLEELGYKHIPSPRTEVKDVVRLYLHYLKKRALKEK